MVVVVVSVVGRLGTASSGWEEIAESVVEIQQHSVWRRAQVEQIGRSSSHCYRFESLERCHRPRQMLTLTRRALIG